LRRTIGSRQLSRILSQIPVAPEYIDRFPPKVGFGVGLRATARRDGRLIAPHGLGAKRMPQQKISALHPTMNQFVDLSMESVIHHRFQTFTQLRVIFACARNPNENDDASSTGDACHMSITAERSVSDCAGQRL
jgi:hypothetical protein